MTESMRHVAQVPEDAWDISSEDFRRLLLENATSAAHDARKAEKPCHHHVSVARDGENIRIIAICADRRRRRKVSSGRRKRESER